GDQGRIILTIGTHTFLPDLPVTEEHACRDNLTTVTAHRSNRAKIRVVSFRQPGHIIVRH
ncbi:MAG: hypothetical protein JSW59_00985, partial [Phycisphaerales bacterium]